MKQNIISSEDTEESRNNLAKPSRIKTQSLNLFRCAIFFSIILGSFLFFGIGQASAATYYVDATNGNDSWAGTQSTPGSGNGPWKTLSKAYLKHVIPGDTIALKRGEVWYEGLSIYYGGSAGNPVTWTAYGTGAAPIIKGSNLATSWTQDGSNYYTSYHGCPVKVS